ncbi:hypothetical protein HK103_002966 [Boothiomyces macroporosus]|uniref:Probable ubiquitin carboxyl-terminal hydrolase MINDY-4 n=1 Tax=Boothiomyces macroporosus TaxID=261099 RepID=A0AAD5Y9C1_9FUNG|nr:hypothetical protein HK103_002966 [Boothiomyces macroporosus]
MTETPSVNTLCISLIREFLSAGGFKNTLEAFKTEAELFDPNYHQTTISSRKELAKYLGLSKQIIKNKQSEKPFETQLQVLVDYITSKTMKIKETKKDFDKEKEMIIPQSQPNKLNAKDLLTMQPYKSEVKKPILQDVEIIDDLDLSDTEITLQARTSASHPIILSKFTLIEEKELSNILFPKSPKPGFSPEWKGKGFNFQTIPELQYGLIQSKGGPCGLLASCQAVIIKHLLIMKAVKNNHLKPTAQQSRRALIDALTEIIWRAGENRAILVLQNTENRTGDLTAGLGYMELNYKQSLWDNLDSHIKQDGRGNGLIQFLMSVILSRGTSKVKGDMDEMSECLMGKHSYCTQDMVNLILVGKAISNPHDGNIDLGGQLFKGINEPCEIGQLSLFEYYENLNIGKHAKNPKYPIYVICSESHYTCMFCTGSMTGDVFDVYYYDGLANQTEEIRLTLSLGKRLEDKRDLVPPIELCLQTKWGKDLHVNWNETEPLL